MIAKDSQIKGQVLIDNAASLAHHAVRKGESDAAIAGVRAYVDQQITIVVTSISALVTRITTVEASIGDALARITELESAFADANGSLAQYKLTVQASFGAANARITTEITARANADGALATRIDTLEASIGDINARISTVQTTIVTLTSALATRVTTLEASMDAALARITTIETAYVTADTALGQRIDTVAASVADVAASIVTETTARVNADGALATQITTLTASLGTTNASVVTESSARIAADGQIQAMWGVSININGQITGRIQLSGNNQSSTFKLSVDKIELTNPAYAANPFPSIVEGSGISGFVFHTLYGTGTPNVFEGLSGTVPKNANVFVMGRLSGVGVGSGFDLSRLRYAGVNTFSTEFWGQCKNGTVWYRIKSGAFYSNWKIMGTFGWNAPGSTEAYHTIGGFNKNDIAVGALEEIEFGFNGLDGDANASATDSDNDIYNGALKVLVVNL